MQDHEIAFTKANPDDEQVGDDQLFAIRYVRHDRSGYRVSRYVLTKDYGWVWDETHKFYPTLDYVMIAFETKDYRQGEKDF